MSKLDDALMRSGDAWLGQNFHTIGNDAVVLAEEVKRIRAAKLEITAEDLTDGVQAIFEAAVPEHIRKMMDPVQVNGVKQRMLDDLWPGLESILKIANDRLRAAVES